jgi:A/G-specific adenine glycosylase
VRQLKETGKVRSKEWKFSSRLLKWRTDHRADFPWRKTHDLYKILVSEMLLRKTTRRQVREIFTQFFQKYPFVLALADARPEEIEEIIRPLGMEHKRAQLLKDMAFRIVSEYGGAVPTTEEELLALPGVGIYATNAVLCFGVGMDVPLVDTNAIRVMQRVFSLEAKKKRARTDPEMWKAVGKLIPRGKARDFNLAMLDFAASVCLPKNPKCPMCQLLDVCDYGRR